MATCCHRLLHCNKTREEVDDIAFFATIEPKKKATVVVSIAFFVVIEPKKKGDGNYSNITNFGYRICIIKDVVL